MVEEGPAEAVLRRPRHPYTLALLQAVPTRESTIEELRAIPGAPPGVEEIPTGCPFMPRCPFAEPACAEPVQATGIGEGRMSACRRHELLGDLEEVGR
jgi:oligopeptide/dipeptide ABC transporter ATP-binding protein